MMTAIPEWIKSLSLLITAIGGFVGIWFGIKKQRTAATSNHAEGAEKSGDVNMIIHSLVSGIEDAAIVSVDKVRNGGHNAVIDEPKYMKILTSTDYQTWLQWKEWFQMEPKLVSIHAAKIKAGETLYAPENLDNPDAHKWFEANGIKMTSTHLIGINDLEGHSYSLVINYTEKHELNMKAKNIIRIAVNQLAALYEPKGWISKKNYYKN